MIFPIGDPLSCSAVPGFEVKACHISNGRRGQAFENNAFLSVQPINGNPIELGVRGIYWVIGNGECVMQLVWYGIR